MEEPADRRPDGTPTDTNPGLTVADFGAAPIGVPNFVIDQFTIPPFLLPIYQACGTQYGIPWQVLASINRIETAFGTNLNVSTAGALGWMQFMPSTWRMYGVDANNDNRKDPYNPVDAICAAARYLKAAGGEDDLRTAIFAYNHADWYVDEVLLYANQYGKLPEPLVSSLTGLTEGARFPVAANARYADDISEREALERSKPGKGAPGNVADVISGSPTRRGINIYSREGAPVVAVNDGVITDIGKSDEARPLHRPPRRLRQPVHLRPARRGLRRLPGAEAASGSRPRTSSSSPPTTTRPRTSRRAPGPRSTTSRPTSLQGRPDSADEPTEDAGPVNTEDAARAALRLPRAQEQRRPRRPHRPARLAAGREDARATSRSRATSPTSCASTRRRWTWSTLKEGSKVTAGTVLGRIGKTDELAPHLHFSIRPAGRGAPKIDPKPILDGWKLLEATAIYRAAGEDPFHGAASAGQVLLMSKPQLIERALTDPTLEIYACGRSDIRTGQIDRRVLAMLEFLTARGYQLTITSLKCGHSVLTTSGNVSEHSSGNAVDIAQINGQPVLGNQGPGTLSEALVKDLLTLQGTMEPHQIISLMDYFGADNTFAMGDHDDHVHVGYMPQLRARDRAASRSSSTRSSSPTSGSG